MFTRSISSTSANATAQATARSLMIGASRSREAASSFLESSTSGMRVPGRQDHGGGRDRTGQRAHARLVDPRDPHDPVAPERALVAQHRAQALALGAVVVPPARDRGQDRLRPGARIGAQRGLERGGEGAAAVDVVGAKFGQRLRARADDPHAVRRGARARPVRGHGGASSSNALRAAVEWRPIGARSRYFRNSSRAAGRLFRARSQVATM